MRVLTKSLDTYLTRILLAFNFLRVPNKAKTDKENEPPQVAKQEPVVGKKPQKQQQCHQNEKPPTPQLSPILPDESSEMEVEDGEVRLGRIKNGFVLKKITVFFRLPYFLIHFLVSTISPRRKCFCPVPRTTTMWMIFHQATRRTMTLIHARLFQNGLRVGFFLWVFIVYLGRAMAKSPHPTQKCSAQTKKKSFSLLIFGREKLKKKRRESPLIFSRFQKISTKLWLINESSGGVATFAAVFF